MENGDKDRLRTPAWIFIHLKLGLMPSCENGALSELAWLDTMAFTGIGTPKAVSTGLPLSDQKKSGCRPGKFLEAEVPNVTDAEPCRDSRFFFSGCCAASGHTAQPIMNRRIKNLIAIAPWIGPG